MTPAMDVQPALRIVFDLSLFIVVVLVVG